MQNQILFFELKIAISTLQFNSPTDSSPFLLRYSFASAPLKSLYGMGEKWDLQGICMGVTTDFD